MNKHRFAILIPARNESAVIKQLLDSLHSQEYPQKDIDIFVIADNCTDDTAKIAEQNGAIVYLRKNNKQIGKGYALDYLLNKIWKNYPNRRYDAYIIFDADNLVDKNFITKINKVYSDGYDIVSPYRNSKNYGSSWLSATSSIYFLYHSKLFRHRFNNGINCATLGTGFLISHNVIERYNGWKFFTLGEDAELSMRAVKDGFKIGYADEAIIYDEQPVTFIDFWRQRLRWVRGHLQVAKIYGNSPATTTFDPLVIATILEFLSLLSILAISIFSITTAANLWPYILLAITMLYIPTFIIGIRTIMTEKSKIHAKTITKYTYVIFFPLMILLFIFAAIMALFSCDRKEWHSISHEGKCLNELDKA